MKEWNKLDDSILDIEFIETDTRGNYTGLLPYIETDTRGRYWFTGLH